MDIREKLIELLTKQILIVLALIALRVASFTMKKIACISLWLMMISNGVTVQEWIPVTERRRNVIRKCYLLSTGGKIDYIILAVCIGKKQNGLG